MRPLEPPVKGPGIGWFGLGVEDSGLVWAMKQTVPVSHHQHDAASLWLIGEVADECCPSRATTLPVLFPTDPTPRRHMLPPIEQLPRRDRGVNGLTGSSPDAQLPIVAG